MKPVKIKGKWLVETQPVAYAIDYWGTGEPHIFTSKARAQAYIEERKPKRFPQKPTPR